MLSLIILTYNEEQNLPHCLESVKPLEPELIVVDSGSTDRTVEIAKSYGARVLHHAFVNQSTQFNWALENANPRHEWVMRLDADERLTPELAEEIREKLPSMPAGVCGIEIRRRMYFGGKWIRHGGIYPLWLLRIWRRSQAHCETRNMDEHMVLRSGSTVRLRHDFIDDNRKGVSYWVDKHNSYADREAKDLLAPAPPEQGARLTAQAARTRWLKERVYGRVPLFLRALLYWVYRYFLRLGFLDGKEGMMYHFLQGFWYRFLVDTKIYLEFQPHGRHQRGDCA